LGIYDNKEAAIADEITLHKAYDVATNPHFANKVRQTSVGFSFAGVKRSPFTTEHRIKLSMARKGKQLLQPRTKEACANLSRALLNSEAHKKASLKRRGIPHTPEHNANVSKALRDKSPRFNWVNELLGVSLENKSVLDILDLYPNLHYSHMQSVTKGRLSQHKGWRVLP
jgi:hypothetical protein